VKHIYDTVEEFWSWQQVKQAIYSAGSDSLTKFQTELASFIQVQPESLWFMPSGHQGLEWLLKIRQDPRCVVLVPALNCNVVEDAIKGAGYQPQLYDFSPIPGQFDWERVIAQINPSVGVLIVTHYFGVPIDFRPVIEHCKALGVIIIEDCAHTLGGAIEGWQVGTLGDAAIFSFNYDKPISLGWGGLVVINTPYAFDTGLSPNYRTPSIDQEMNLLEEFVVAMAARRKMIPRQNSLVTRILRRARMIKSSQFHKDSEISIGAVQAELGRWCLPRYRSVIEKRNESACIISNAFPASTWPVESDVKPAWLKQKLLIKDIKQLVAVSNRCQKNGFRAGNFNWPSLIGAAMPSEFPVASEVTSKWIDVPIHQNLDHEKLKGLIALL